MRAAAVVALIFLRLAPEERAAVATAALTIPIPGELLDQQILEAVAAAVETSLPQQQAQQAALA
jgi:hypothetical protein